MPLKDDERIAAGVVLRDMVEEVEKVDAGDVHLEPIAPKDCDNCLDLPATLQIRLDLRELGMSIVLQDRYCSICGPMMTGRLKATLPQEQF